MINVLQKMQLEGEHIETHALKALRHSPEALRAAGEANSTSKGNEAYSRETFEATAHEATS